jgi:hypothetical protein
MLGENADLYSELLPRIAREARLEQLRSLRTAYLGRGHFRYWVRGKRRRADGVLIVATGYMDIVVDSDDRHVANWEYLPDLTVKYP